ncbi:tudor domain-containing protein 5-like isoform X2 [Tachypleus tridentatus]|uniref:tudor domain-containing protein 5-like isoform X2 n=1 Tax=Tachypleus tridentatus TaxID=6853 RepID=UPI003FD111FC
MSKNAELLNDTKMQIRSLLLSAQKGLTGRKLCEDYLHENGMELPYRSLGFISISQFLDSIPDVAKCVYNKSLQEYIYKGVVDETTKHIEKLVSRQKVSNSNMSRRIPRMKLKPNRNISVQPKVPASLRRQIQELMMSYPNGINIGNFETAFIRHFGMSLNCIIYGFDCVETLLRDIGDIVVLESTSYGLQVNATKRTSMPKSDNSGCKNDTHKSEHVKKLHSSFGHVSEVQNISNTETPVTSCLKDENIQTQNQFDHFKKDFDDFCKISNKMKEDFRKVLDNHENGIMLTRFPSEYEKVTHQQLDYESMGYYSLLELVGELPDVFLVSRSHHSHEWTLYDARYRKKEDIRTTEEQSIFLMFNSGSKEKKKTDTENETVEGIKNKILKVILVYPEGIPLKQFEDTYKMNCQEELPWRKAGFSDLRTYLETVTNYEVDVQCKNQGQIVVYSQQKESSLKSLSAAPSLAKADLSDVMELKSCIPTDAVPPGVDFTYMTLPSDFDFSKYHEVFVSNIDNPSQIWIQLKGRDTTDSLNSLMDKLEVVYYNKIGDFYRIPNSNIMIGGVCAALFPEDDNWHRALITGIPSHDIVEVLYVDYGSRCKVKKEHIRYLRQKFFGLKAQAMKSQLANVKPVSGKKWTDAAKLRLLEMCMDRPLMALMTDVIAGDEFSVYLCDTSYDEDFHLNDALVKEGHAVFGNVNEPDLPPSLTQQSSLLGNFSQLLSSNPLSLLGGLKQTDANLQLMNMLAGYRQSLGGMSQLNQLLTLQSLSASGLDSTILSKLMNVSSSSDSSSPFYSMSMPVSSDFSISNALTTTTTTTSASAYASSISPQSETGQHLQAGASASEENESETFEEDEDFVREMKDLEISLNIHAQRIQLKEGCVVSLINFCGEPFLTLEDIAYLMSWKLSLLQIMLKVKCINVPFVGLCITDHEEFFNEMDRFRVRGFRNGDHVKSSIQLCPLASVCVILESLRHPSTSLIPKIKKLLQEFDPKDPYWMGESSNKNLQEDDLTVLDIPVYILKFTLDVLENKRKDLLTQMVDSTLFDYNPVDKLEAVEKKILLLRRRIFELESTKGKITIETDEDSGTSETENKSSAWLEHKKHNSRLTDSSKNSSVLSKQKLKWGVDLTWTKYDTDNSTYKSTKPSESEIIDQELKCSFNKNDENGDFIKVLRKKLKDLQESKMQKKQDPDEKSKEEWLNKNLSAKTTDLLPVSKVSPVMPVTPMAVTQAQSKSLYHYGPIYPYVSISPMVQQQFHQLQYSSLPVPQIQVPPYIHQTLVYPNENVQYSRVVNSFPSSIDFQGTCQNVSTVPGNFQH